MADHGEAFGEHGENHHGIFLYDETIRVPLLIKAPGQHAGSKVTAPVGLVDVAPTILRMSKVPVPREMQGTSLLSLIQSSQDNTSESENSKSRRPVYSESAYGHLSFGWSKLRSWRTSKYLYIGAPDRELYDQVSDPLAARNLASSSKAVADTVAAQVAEFYRQTKGGVAERKQLDFEQSESLHALGYLSSSSGATSETSDKGGADPKQKIGIANRLYEALVDMEEEEFPQAIPILEQVLKEEPNTFIASLQLGRAYMALKDYQKAIMPLQNLVDKKPEDAFARYELGCALVKTGRWDEAQPQFETAVSQMTSSSIMHFYLALVYQRTSHIPEATTEFQSALHIDPDNFPANLLLGRLFIVQQRATDALPYLTRAAKLRPDSIDVHRFLSDMYRDLGQQANAQRELDEAERIQQHGGSRLGTPKEGSAAEKRRP
jgi:tetratricopeptide (TPR) repeat protein